ncbi:GntR family transcriptional regulator [Devosia nitrariae]|uniref:GntR family transcriptional regulator n=1 Tax=Devosia nitrariae TaxID=2071872 RepID=A0ABQ5W6Q1_9HYPH|nr:GntR family transcriptional regulator [Devosia nitrariae]GLQ55605.1 GntR family transcriptional regulator [Devosia nitrariae]
MATSQNPPASTAIKRPPRLGDEVYNTIYAQLMSQKILPGSRISIDNLARELGVSQTPIREALSRLEAQGLVVKTHLIGFSAASQMDRTRLDQLYELRLLLEPFAARKAATLMSSEQFEALKRMTDDMRNDRGQGRVSYSEFARLDSQFHDLIAQASGNDLVQETLANLHTHVHLFRLFHHQQATSDANAEHAKLIEAFEARDQDRAEQAMRTHVERSYARFRSFFED